MASTNFLGSLVHLCYRQHNRDVAVVMRRTKLRLQKTTGKEYRLPRPERGSIGKYTDLPDAGNGDHGRSEEGKEGGNRENPEPQAGAREKCHNQHQEHIGDARGNLLNRTFLLLPKLHLIGGGIERRHLAQLSGATATLGVPSQRRLAVPKYD